MTAPRLVFHIGAPKCGSSALQSALAARPELTTPDGMRLRYTTLQTTGSGFVPVTGTRVTQLARASMYGYTSCPNFGPLQDNDGLVGALEAVAKKAFRAGTVPVLSQEGWISHPARFADLLARLGHPPVAAVAFLRPPVDWLNASWWQWGVWGGRTLDVALANGQLAYRFGRDLEEWSRIPNLTLHVQSARPDAVRAFAELFAVDLPGPSGGNVASSPALIGFLLRNRQFRPSAHESGVEFVIQRWCPPTGKGRPWAINARHVHAMRPVVEQNRAALARFLPEDDLRSVLRDPGWTREKVYHAAILSGTSVLDDPADFPMLYAALTKGVAAAAEAAGRPMPPLPDPAPDGAGPEAWDPVLCAVLETLVELDARLRASSSLGARLRHGLLRGRRGT